jgi:CxxC motif-containing protein
MEVTYTGHKILKVDNTDCKKGKEYAYQELFEPVRILTSTVFVKNGHLPLVSIRTDKPIPKGKIFEVMKKLSGKKLTAPVKIGDIIIKNVVNTGVNIIATKNVYRKQ